MKRFLSVILTLSIVCCGLCVKAEDEYATRGEVCGMLIDAADDYNPGVCKTDILQGYDDGELHEERYVTRAEALVMLRRAFGDIPELKGANKLLAIPSEDFYDIPEWARTELADIFAAGIAAGTEKGQFSPDDNVTHGQMRLFINRTYRIFGTNPRDDYYAAVNKELLDEVELPEGYGQFGTLMDEQSTYDLAQLISDIAAKPQKMGTKEYRLKSFYDCYTNMDARDAAGLGELAEYAEVVDRAENIADFSELEYDAEYIAEFFTGFAVDTDIMDSESYATYFVIPEVYDKRYFESDEFRNRLTEHYKRIAMLSGESEAEARDDAEDCYEFEKELSQTQLTDVERRDMNGQYNVYTLKELDDIFDTVDLEKIYDKTGLKNRNKIIVTNDGRMRQLAAMLTDANTEMLKSVVKFEIIDAYSCYLTRDFMKEYDDFTGYLYGIDGDTDVEYTVVSEILSFMPDYAGEVYAEKYNDNEANAEIKAITEDIIAAYRDRINSSEWMSEGAKKTALGKLDNMRIKIGAPNVWDTYTDSVEILAPDDGGTLLGNIFNINDAYVRYMYSLEGTKVDKSRWMMYPYEQNACYGAPYNDITITTALMRTMAYNKDAEREYNLGAIGSIIAHEISHAFDAIGSQFDENGNVNSWWSPEDKARYDDICAAIEKYYAGLEGAPGIEVPTAQTLTENMADMAAMEIITDIADKYGMDYDLIYSGYAHLWYVTMNRRTAEYLSITDVHSFPALRVNRVLQSIDRFYETYGITEKDGMYIPTEARAHFWR